MSMDALVGFTFVIFIPAAELLLISGAGWWLLRRGRRVRSYFQVSLGGALILSAVCSLLFAIGFFIDVRRTGGWAGLALLYMGLIPLIGAAVVVPVASLVMIGIRALLRHSQRRQWIKPAQTRSTVIALAVLIVTLLFAGIFVGLPRSHLYPYRYLSVEYSGIPRELTLKGYRTSPNGRGSGWVTVCSVIFVNPTDGVVPVNPGAPWAGDFATTLDWSGRITFTATNTSTGEVRVYKLPFKTSRYYYDDGKLYDEDSRPVEWREGRRIDLER